MEDRIIEAIKQTDKILVGIGEEWLFDEKNILNDDNYKDIYLEADGEYSWLKPFIVYHFQKNHDDSRQKTIEKLAKILEDKDYFVISLAYDVDLTKCGLDNNRIVSPCGNQIYLQEKHNSSGMLLDVKESLSFNNLMKDIDNLINKNIKMSEISNITANGDELVFNIKRARDFDMKYNEAAYLPMWQKYQEWLSKTISKEILLLELGVSLNFPTVIRFPFEKIAYINNKAYLIRVHEKLYQLTNEIKEKAVSVPSNSLKFIESI